MLEKTFLDWTYPNGPEGIRQAVIGNEASGDMVQFVLTHRPTCYRRGRYLLQIHIPHGDYHHLWGCFDEQDQPERNYHLLASAIVEADQIAKVLLEDRLARGPIATDRSQEAGDGEAETDEKKQLVRRVREVVGTPAVDGVLEHMSVSELRSFLRSIGRYA